MIPMRQEQPQIILSADDARGGVTGHGVRYVFAFGLGAVVLALVVVLLAAL